MRGLFPHLKHHLDALAGSHVFEGLVPAQGLAAVGRTLHQAFYDRLQHSFVIDFIDWFIPCTTEGSIQRSVIDFFAPCRGINHHWPTFNVADVAISIGIGLFVIDALFLAPKRDKANEETAIAEPTE